MQKGVRNMDRTPFLFLAILTQGTNILPTRNPPPLDPKDPPCQAHKFLSALQTAQNKQPISKNRSRKLCVELFPKSAQWKKPLQEQIPRMKVSPKWSMTPTNLSDSKAARSALRSPKRRKMCNKSAQTHRVTNPQHQHRQ
jgi:hypothetical protein